MLCVRSIFLLGLALLPACGWAQTVAVDAQSLMQRLDRIERRLQAVEARGGAGGGVPYTGANASDLELRMQDLENESSQVNGNVERLGNAVNQLARKLDSVMKDMDMRLQDLEQKPAAAAPVEAVAPAPQASADDIPANLSPEEHYNRGYAYLTAADYPKAQKWLEAFVKKHPTDKLGDNAWYWLGEVYLVENNPTEAVKAFKNGLTYFPKGAKAPANLLKMGVALQQLKQPQLAKGAWDKLVTDYPRSVEATKAKDYLLALKGTGKPVAKP